MNKPLTALWALLSAGTGFGLGLFVGGVAAAIIPLYDQHKEPLSYYSPATFVRVYNRDMTEGEKNTAFRELKNDVSSAGFQCPPHMKLDVYYWVGRNKFAVTCEFN